MGRPKTKPRAQRKFAQGAYIPPQNQPSSSSTLTRPFHSAVNSPGSVTYNNCSAKDMLTVMSLRRMHPHLNLNPVVKLEYDHELALKAESTMKKKIKEKNKCKENNNNNTIKKKKYELRNRPNLRKRRGSVSDSGEDMPLSYLAGDSHPSPVKTRAVEGRTVRRVRPLLARPIPSTSAITSPVNNTQNGTAVLYPGSPLKPPKRLTKPVKKRFSSKVKKRIVKKLKSNGLARKNRLRSVLISAAECNPVAANDDTEVEKLECNPVAANDDTEVEKLECDPVAAKDDTEVEKLVKNSDNARGVSSERRRLVLRLTPLEIEQRKLDTVQKKRCSKKVASRPAVTSRFYVPNAKPKKSRKRKLVTRIPTPRKVKNPLSSEELAFYPEQDLSNKFVSVEKLTYRPTQDEFKDPITYIQKIQATASKYGICKIIPPEEFSVPCHLDDNSVFTTINQYLGRLYQRWGETIKELTCIQTYVAKIANLRERDQFTKCPMFDGVELDLVKLYHTVVENGGIEELMAHGERWARVVEKMSLVSPRGKPDHKKLEKLYCKHVLPYESLTSLDRNKMFKKVSVVWKERFRSITRRALRPLHYQKRMLGECDSDDDDTPLNRDCDDVRNIGKPCFDRIEECTAKGRTMNLATYRRLASQIQAMRFPSGSNATTEQIEEQYWKILSLGTEHLCVLSAYIDTAVDKLGHTSNRDGPGGSHPWNLKRLGENPLNVLSFLGKTLSVTNPTLSLNQLYSTNCWHKDPHLLAWMDYMHEGATKIWYAVSENDSGVFRKTMENLAPFAVQNKGIWLASDTTMVPPGMLLAKDVKLQRIEQNPGEFIVVFPGAYASSIATGLTISESIYFEDKEWVCSIDQIFQQMREDYEPGMFSNIVLLFRMARDPLVSMDVMSSIHKSIEAIIDTELKIRREATSLHFDSSLVKPDGDRGPVSWPNQEECSICRAPLILSKTVRFNEHRLLVCLKHGVQLYECAPIEDRDEPPPITILYSEEELMEILDFVRRRAAGEDVFEQIQEIYKFDEGTVTVKVEEYIEES